GRTLGPEAVRSGGSLRWAASPGRGWIRQVWATAGQLVPAPRRAWYCPTDCLFGRKGAGAGPLRPPEPIRPGAPRAAVVGLGPGVFCRVYVFNPNVTLLQLLKQELFNNANIINYVTSTAVGSTGDTGAEAEKPEN